ncbi:MAG: hypothetical protein M3Q31_14785 [Actinomycetota bacterium]|nr:hypothetical protein [Actinomycetota bacterium]
MQLHLTALLAALEPRCRRIEEAIAANGDAELQRARDEAQGFVDIVRVRAQALAGHPALSDPALHGSALGLYLGLALRLDGAERLVVPALERFDAGDRQLSRLLAELLEQSGWTAWSPAATTFSTEYFSAASRFRVLYVPAGEHRRLLRVPDLCHEVGHCLMVDHEAELGGDLDADLSHWSGTEQIKPGATHPPEFYDEVFQLWSEAWREEFACDVVGTFLSGRSYGRQHLALCMSIPTAPYDHAPSHPSDDMRAWVIERTLRRLGQDGVADASRADWDAYVRASGAEPSIAASAGYQDRYPLQFREAVVERVLDGLRGLGLTPFDEARPPGPGYLPGLVDQAWETFLASPGAYDDWERQTIKDLYRTWGL